MDTGSRVDRRRRPVARPVEAESPRADPATDSPFLHSSEPQSRRMLQEILNNSTAVIYVKDAAYRYLFINSHFERLFSVTNAQIIGRSDYDVFPAAIADPLRANDQRVLAEGESLHFEEVVPQDDGPHTYVSVKFPLRDANGTIHAVCGISTDITDRQRIAAELRQSEAKLLAVLESSPDPIFAVDRDYRLIACNSVLTTIFSQLFGRPPRIGDNLRDEIPPGLADDWHAMLDRALAGERLTVERPMPFDDELRHFVVSLNPTIADGRITGVTAFARDVTTLRRAEEEARRHQAELAHTLRLQTMGEVAASLAHEINQPLGAIANYAQGCKHRLQSGTIDQTELLQIVGEIAREALRAGEITRRVRELLRKDEPQRAAADINQIVAAALAIIAPAAQDRAVHVRFRPGAYLPGVCVDRIQIEQVVLNLVLNAVDAVEAGGCSREVEVLSSTAGEGEVEVAVRDHGVGLDANRVEQVFEPFLTTKPHGLGMGLAISRSIIQAHGGRLWAASNADGGATFRFVLPVAEA